MRWVRVSPGYRLLVVFSLTILGPGLLLAFLGAHGLWRERQLVNQRLSERLEYSAKVAAGSLSEQLERLQARAEAGVSSDAPIAWPADGSWAFVDREGDRIQVYPKGVLPYELDAQERVAFDAPPTPAEIAHREARASMKAGRTGDAIRRWRELEAEGGTIGTVPADLVAGFALARFDRADAQRFYDRLTGGRWRIEKARYSYYSSELLDRVKVSDRQVAALRLADAVEGTLAGNRVMTSEGIVYLAFRRDAPFAALVVSDRFLAAQVPPAADVEATVSRITADGRVLYGALAGSRSELRATRSLNVGGISWAIDVEPKDAALFGAGVRRQIDLYLGMMVLVLALFVTGGMIITRTVRREVEVARLKSDFVSTVSHEFRSPLTGVRQLAELLVRDRVLDEMKRRQYYDLILRESERMARLVESVLDFARMEDGRRQYRQEPLDTAAWLKGVATEFEGEASRAGYVLETSISEDLPGLIGDREALSTAVRNLLDNAVKYAPEAKTVWLDARAAGDRVRISVRDRGVGIPVRHQSRIFEKFYRVDGDLARRVKGVGLGLSLVRHIVESHHGTITVDSREGHGSTFSIELAGAA